MFRDSIVGLYEGKFFNHAMEIFRNKINSNNRKVIFLPTSDDYFWIKKHLISKEDVYFSREMIRESRAAKPTFNEIHRSWRDMKLASKGSSSYGVDLAVLALCNHTIMDYGTFGMWAGLLAGGEDYPASGIQCCQVWTIREGGIKEPDSLKLFRSPDMVWWETAVAAGMDNVEFVDVGELDERVKLL